MKNVFILGFPKEQDRLRAFMNAILKKGDEYGIYMSYMQNFIPVAKKNPNLIDRIKYYVQYAMLNVKRAIAMYADIQNLKKADYVYVAPLNIVSAKQTPRYFYLYKQARKLDKKIIVEYYISMYDTHILDRKLDYADNQSAKDYQEIDRDKQCNYRVIYLNECERDRYRRLASLDTDGDNCMVIPLNKPVWGVADLPFFNGKSDIFTMVWWGSYIPLQGLDKIIMALNEAIKVDNNIRLYILGNNANAAKPYIELIDKNPGLSEHVVIHNDWSLRNGRLVPFVLQNCDLAFGAFGDTEKAANVILNKSIEAIASKIPLLSMHSPAMEPYFGSDAVYYCDNSPSAIAESILKIKNSSKQEIESHIETSFEVFKRYFSNEAAESLYGRLIDGLD